jgi:hypothetical protein
MAKLKEDTPISLNKAGPKIWSASLMLPTILKPTLNEMNARIFYLSVRVIGEVKT